MNERSSPMKMQWILITLALALGWSNVGDAAVIYLGENVTVPTEQPINAIIVDGNGNTVEKVFYYNPSLGGVDIGGSWDAECTSIVLPDYNVRYLWAGGYWLDEGGYYWLGGRRYFYNYPGWGVHWSGYWSNHWHDSWHDHYYHHYDHWHDHGHWHHR